MFPGLDIFFSHDAVLSFYWVYITIRKIVIQNLLCPRYVFRPKLDPVFFFFFFFFLFFFLFFFFFKSYSTTPPPQ